MVLDLLGMGSMHGLLSWLIGDLIPVSEICLPYSEEFRPYCDQRILPYPVTLGSQKTALRFPTALLDYPLIRTVDDCEAHGLDFLAEARGEGLQRDVADQARRIIYQELRDKWSLLSLDSLSERLGRNRETLRRQLKASGATYNSIKDSCRCELGLRLLRHTNLKIEDVATRLDFCDSDAFRRSFRDWVGISPSDYRRAGMPR
jgi:AraC-like DNA-binding protein